MLRDTTAVTTVENCLLLLKGLQVQSRWQEMRTILIDDDSADTNNDLLLKLPRTQRSDWTELACEKLDDWNGAKNVHIQLLHKTHGQQWSVWKVLIGAYCNTDGGESACLS